MRNLFSENLILKKEIKYLKKTVTDLNLKINSTELKLDGFEQYIRIENLEIHGVPLKNGENTNNIVMKLAENLNVKLDNRDISTSHRLLTNGKSDSKLNLPPLIIVRFSNRDKRNEIYNKQSNVNDLATGTTSLVTPKLVHSSNLSLRENLTKFRKNLFNEAQKVKADLKFKFIWTCQGQIFLRKNEKAKLSKFHHNTTLPK